MPGLTPPKINRLSRRYVGKRRQSKEKYDMAYARFLEGDVYIFYNVSGGYTCCACLLKAREPFWSTDAIIEHIQAHVAAGHSVPPDTVQCIEYDRAENDAHATAVQAGMCAACDGTGTCRAVRPHPGKDASCSTCQGTLVCAECRGTGGTVAWVESRHLRDA